jgi:hypothetical protein
MNTLGEKLAIFMGFEKEILRLTVSGWQGKID